MAMLRKQKQISFKGGLDKFLLTRNRLEDIRSLSIAELWFACDQPEGIQKLQEIGKRLFAAGFKRSHLYCYVLIGNDARENTHRLHEVYKTGFMPFAQLLRNAEDDIYYSRSWKRFQCRWSRPAAIESRNHWLREKYNIGRPNK